MCNWLNYICCASSLHFYWNNMKKAPFLFLSINETNWNFTRFKPMYVRNKMLRYFLKQKENFTRKVCIRVYTLISWCGSFKEESVSLVRMSHSNDKRVVVYHRKVASKGATFYVVLKMLSRDVMCQETSDKCLLNYFSCRHIDVVMISFFSYCWAPSLMHQVWYN